uniref:Pkinase_C domain-containing protein n=1 Tax=Echinostoma caproni TaxID=27848 RepID=A0A183A490_9TREM
LVENSLTVSTQPSNNNNGSTPDPSHEVTSEVDRLVDLSNLGSENTSGRRRYRRGDFESGVRLPNTTLGNDPFSQLDPFNALAEFADSPAS